MTDFSNPPRRYLSGYDQKVNDVSDIFYGHWDKMDKERRAAIEDIAKWRREWIDLINKHADAQTHLLKDDYNRQRPAFDAKRKESLEMMNDCSNSQQHDLIFQLLNECRTLEFQVAKLQFIKRDVEFPTVFTVDQLKKQKELDARTRDESILRDNAALKYGNGREDSQGASANSKTTDRERSSVADPYIAQDQSRTKDDKIKNNSTDRTNWIEKCPMCYMIFADTMSQHDRVQHVDEHLNK